MHLFVVSRHKKKTDSKKRVLKKVFESCHYIFKDTYLHKGFTKLKPLYMSKRKNKVIIDLARILLPENEVSTYHLKQTHTHTHTHIHTHTHTHTHLKI